MGEEMTKIIEVGTEWEGSINRCPICNKRAGFYEIDSMGTARCQNCGSRFLPTMGGVMYVGDWESYACKDMYEPPPNPITYKGTYNLIPDKEVKK